MENTLALIQRVRRTLPTKSDYAVAKALGMAQTQLTRVLKGEFGLGPKAVIRISELCQMDLRDVLVLVEEDKATTPADKAFWGSRSPRLPASIASAILACAALLITQGKAEARTVDITRTSITSYTLCEVSKMLDFLRELWIRFTATSRVCA